MASLATYDSVFLFVSVGHQNSLLLHFAQPPRSVGGLALRLCIFRIIALALVRSLFAMAEWYWNHKSLTEYMSLSLGARVPCAGQTAQLPQRVD
jgi:hypothetical protein